MNKMFTSVAILQLVNRGQVDLDAPVGNYLPNYPNKNLASKVKIRHLLSHQGRNRRYFHAGVRQGTP